MTTENVRFAARVDNLRASDIREILKVTQRPEVISFAGGLPAAEVLPGKELARVASELLMEHGPIALQYSPTEGLQSLRQRIADRLHRRFGIRRSADEVLMVSGSQQALDLTGKLFVDPGDAILCESPTYLGAINAFQAYEPRFLSVPTDDEGMRPESLERALAAEDRAKLIYVVPDFQNPSGRRWSIGRRQALLETAARHNVPVVEDSPYAELSFDGDPLPPVASFDRDGTVIYLGTFSKILSPGLRLGWVAADASMLRRYVLVKQGADLHTSTLGQMLADRFLTEYDLDLHIERIRGLYRRRRDAMLAALDEHLGEDVRYTRPVGGLFLWLELPKDMDARQLLGSCLEHNVAFVPGSAFFTDGLHDNTLRLNFSAMPKERINEGIRRFATALHEAMEPLAVGV
ncbi:MAG: PLP-dependent aminotransferase family protein [Holophagae bacterium]|jgi:DNA-binding transcriptional MocR family regulator